MNHPASIPTLTVLAGRTGTERWNRSVSVERILCEMRFLVLQATENPRANLPEFYDWARDLRRGRTNILGGFFRLTDAIQRRGMGNTGRLLALRLLSLAYEYVDLMLPETPAPTSGEEPVPTPLRLNQPIAARNAVVIRGQVKKAA